MATTGSLDAATDDQGQRPAQQRSFRTARIGVLVAALVAASGVLGWQIYGHWARPTVGDQHEVTFTLDHCATAHMEFDGLSVRATDEIFFDWPSKEGAGTVTLTKVYEVSGEEGIRIDGTLELETGQSVKAHGGTTGKMFFTLGCMMPG